MQLGEQIRNHLTPATNVSKGWVVEGIGVVGGLSTMIIKLVCIFFMVIHGMGRAGEDEKRGVVWCSVNMNCWMIFLEASVWRQTR